MFSVRSEGRIHLARQAIHSGSARSSKSLTFTSNGNSESGHSPHSIAVLYAAVFPKLLTVIRQGPRNILFTARLLIRHSASGSPSFPLLGMPKNGPATKY